MAQIGAASALIEAVINAVGSARGVPGAFSHSPSCHELWTTIRQRLSRTSSTWQPATAATSTNPAELSVAQGSAVSPVTYRRTRFEPRWETSFAVQVTVNNRWLLPGTM